MADISNSNIFNAIEDIHHVKDVLVVLVKTEWNASIVDELENGCKRIFDKYGVRYKTIVVPGAVEIPFAIQHCWSHSSEPAAFIALGCVIRGGTPHFDYVCQSVTAGITQLNLTLPVPVLFGILTLDNMQQAMERTGGKHGHKGEEAAISALKMIITAKAIKEGTI